MNTKQRYILLYDNVANVFYCLEQEWQMKTPKMLVIEFFQKFRCKTPLQWERVKLQSTKHLVKCIFPDEFGAKEFVPNRLFSSVSSLALGIYEHRLILGFVGERS